MDLRQYLKQGRGSVTRLAALLGVPASLISQWAKGEEDRQFRRRKPKGRPVPEDRAPAIEFATGFAVTVETLCPETRWQRVRDPSWPHGKPLIDKTPNLTPIDPPRSAMVDLQPESA